jgi:hypothetical protein
VWGKRTAISVLGNIVSHATKCSSRGHDHTLSLDRIPNNILLLGRVVANQALPTISYKGKWASPNFFHWSWPRYRKKTTDARVGFRSVRMVI